MSQEEPLLSDFAEFTPPSDQENDDNGRGCSLTLSLAEIEEDRSVAFSDRSLCGADDPAVVPKPTTTIQ